MVGQFISILNFLIQQNPPTNQYPNSREKKSFPTAVSPISLHLKPKRNRPWLFRIILALKYQYDKCRVTVRIGNLFLNWGNAVYTVVLCSVMPARRDRTLSLRASSCCEKSSAYPRKRPSSPVNSPIRDSYLIDLPTGPATHDYTEVVTVAHLTCTYNNSSLPVLSNNSFISAVGQTVAL